jgi:hypothetical protein
VSVRLEARPSQVAQKFTRKRNAHPSEFGNTEPCGQRLRLATPE